MGKDTAPALAITSDENEPRYDALPLDSSSSEKLASEAMHTACEEELCG
jgi:hypothetical protein